MTSIIEEINQFVDGTSKLNGQEPIEVLMDLALIAGIESFNPFRATDNELCEIAKAIPVYVEECG